MAFLKTDQGLVNGRYIVQVDDYEEGTVQVVYQFGDKVRHAIAQLTDFTEFLAVGD